MASGGGVFYVRGGYHNLMGLNSPIQNIAFPANANATGGLTPTDTATVRPALVAGNSAASNAYVPASASAVFTRLIG